MVGIYAGSWHCHQHVLSVAINLCYLQSYALLNALRRERQDGKAEQLMFYISREKDTAISFFFHAWGH